MRLLYFGDAVASGLDQFLLVALPIFALSHLGVSATWLGLVMSAQYLPSLLVAQRVAAWVDTSDRRRAMAIASSLAAAALIALTLLPVLSRDGLSLAGLLIAAFALGLATLGYQIGSTAIAPTIAADRPVTHVLAGQASVRMVARAVGMGLAGIAMDALGGTTTMLVAAGLLVSRALASRALKLVAASVHAPGPGGGKTSSATDQNPWAIALATPALRLGLGGLFVLNVGGALVGGAYMAYAYELLGLSATTIGIAMTFGTLAALGAVRWVKKALATMSPAPIVAVAGAVAGLVTWILPMTPLAFGVVGLAVYHVVFGAASTLVVVAFTVMRQRLVDNRVLGRVASLSSTLNAASLVAGGALASLFLPILGVIGTMAAGASFAMLAIPFWILLSRVDQAPAQAKSES